MDDCVLTRKQVREVDRRAVGRYGMSGLVLMENAGRGCADILCAQGIAGPVVIFCGKGNNGGDGFVLARHLHNRGYQPHVILLAEPALLAGDAATNFTILTMGDVTWEPFPDEAGLAARLASADWVVDAILGTGAVGAPRGIAAELIPLLNQCAARKLAIDVPSGLDCDTGRSRDPTFRSDVTCTFVAAKPGFLDAGAADWLGEVHVVDIGVPRKLLAELA